MVFISALAAKGRTIKAQRPWPRIVVDSNVWRDAAAGLASGQATLLALWSDGEAVHMGLTGKAEEGILIVSLPCPDRSFPSVAIAHPPALRLERTIRDLHGLVPRDCPDERPWLNHGRWGLEHPLGEASNGPSDGLPYAFHTAEGPPLHQIPVGPVHAGIIEPGHFRFHANGETVVRLEERLGYVHKGIDSLLRGATLDRAASLAGRISGDSTVAYALAFAQAAEAALGLAIPPRALYLRALMAELERLANHFGDIGAICNDASFSLLHAHMGALREHVLRTAHACFGHRLMMDRIVPGGVAADMTEEGGTRIRSLIATVNGTFPELVSLYDNTASLQDRTVTTGVLAAELARQYGAGGYVGRASGRSFDARRWPGYAPYGELSFDVPVREDGDVDARVWIRIEEVRQSVALVDQILAGLPSGPSMADMTRSGGARTHREGISLVEGFRGDVFAWVRLARDGRIAAAHLRDPSWFQWPLLEAAIEGNIVADFPLCNKSFNCSYSGVDV
ncbi:hydrogenase large subunit [Taklimakanibacter lacteus]|uniref:hydrogenase large subunit n=1 Tax=Taklimakanibacter lacteus TaxID=2268456 RepID=UPI000E660008